MDDSQKLTTVENFWERIPFRILEEYKILDFIPSSRSKTFTLFQLWKSGDVAEEFIPDDLLENFNFENGKFSTISNSSHPIGKLCEIFHCDDMSSKKVHKNVVTARQILQAVEKYQFILQKKNLCGRDVGDNFVLFFRPDDLLFAVKIYIFENVLFLEEDFFTAKEVLNTCEGADYDIYRLKLKSSTGKLDVSDMDWILGWCTINLLTKYFFKETKKCQKTQIS